MNRTKSISICFIKVILLFIFCPSYFFPSSHPILLPFHPPFLSSFHPLCTSLPSFLYPLFLPVYLPSYSLSHIYMYIYIFFPELFENILHILCPFTSKYFSMYLLKTRTFSYTITVQLPTSGHLILDYLISNSSMFSISQQSSSWCSPLYTGSILRSHIILSLTFITLSFVKPPASLLPFK